MFFQIISRIISKYLPFWILFLSFIAYFFPQAFTGIRNLTGVGLGLIFLLMGLSLSMSTLISIIRKPKYAFIGVLFKWTIMVGITIVLASLFFSDEPEIATGLILSGTVPSGTSANIYTFIAGGEVALSITMATMDTVISPLLTPMLVQFFAGKFIPIDFWAIFLNIIYIVFIPLFAGLFIQWKWAKQVEYIKPYTAVLSQISLFIVVLSVVSSAQSALQENLRSLPLILIAVFLQVILPMLAGYFGSKLIGVTEVYARAILFHTGICNTALAATLALEHVSSLASVPAVANMVVNLTLGAFMAKLFEYTNDK